MTDASKNFLFSIIIISHSLFGIYWIYYFLQEMRKTIRTKASGLYLTFFLCCNKKKLEQEIEVEDYQRKMVVPFMSHFDEILDYM